MIVQQVPAQQNAYGANFGCRGESCFRKSGRLSRYTGLQIAIKPSLKSPEKRDNHLLYPISRYKPVLFPVRQIVLKVIVRKYYSWTTVILLWLAYMNG